MNPDDARHREPLPDWLRKDLEAAPPLSGQALGRYDYLRDAFLAMARREAAAHAQQRAQPAQAAVDAVFSLAGRLLRLASDAVTRLAPPPARPAFAARGVAGPQATQTAIDRVRKPAGDATIEAATYRSGAGADLELNVLRKADETELRPFTVTIYDAEGTRLAGPVTVEPSQQAPRFPRPSEGSYVLAVSWPGGGGEIHIAFADEH